ncbi:MAG: hypothetical protein RI907_69 [Pseudomonadota bacterium]|jgi:hypothetical protein
MNAFAMDTVNTPGDLAGRVVWQADGPQRGLHNQRPDLLPRLSRGQPASALPGLVSSLLSMCGHAHLLASRLAIAAAQGQARTLTREEARALQLETLREHLRRMWLDWPRLWPGPGDASVAQLSELHGCPVLHGPLPRMVAEAPQVLDGTRAWLATHVFDLDPSLWLSHWQDHGLTWLHTWSARTATWPARWLDQVHRSAAALTQPLRPWWPDDTASLAQLAQRIAADPAHVRQPLWPAPGGIGPVETGPWCRLHQRVATGPDASCSAEWRLAGRLVDLARLALPDHSGHQTLAGSHCLGATGLNVLAQGSLSLPHHTGLSWLEMARGTLLHWVQLDGTGPDARVLSAQVLAPTEWNFHHDGPVAQVLDRLNEPDLQVQAALAVAAWDPCVPFAVCHGQPRPQQEPHDA